MRNKNGFTIIETLTAIFVLTAGVVGAITFINQALRAGKTDSSRLVASYLAQEGMEVVRNIRDSNFLKERLGQPAVWTDGLLECSAGCEADYNSLNLQPLDRYLKFDNGFYNYDSGQDTSFKRKITISQFGTDCLAVEVAVSWQERGNNYNFAAESRLCKWLQ
ncbi:MAG: hypothetical protein V1705_01070 [bacterium]